MTGTYLTWLADEYRAAGLRVVEFNGWRTRARSSGGYANGRPVCTMWHHTASNTTPANDAAFMCTGSSDRPIANVLVARDGETWVLAAGATNTNGKGNALGFSTGTVPADSMNTWAIGVEIANTGVGERYPQAQVDAMFTVSNVHARRLGWQPADLAGHVDYAPTRKIDPAVNDVAGPWAPRSINSSRSWNMADVRAEATARAASPPPPQEDDEMYLALMSDGAVLVVGSAVRPCSVEELNGPLSSLARFSVPAGSNTEAWLRAGAAEYTRRVGM